VFPPRCCHQKGTRETPKGRALKTAERRRGEEQPVRGEASEGRPNGGSWGCGSKGGGTSPRPISTAALRTLLRFQGPPINVVLYHGPYPVDLVRGFILGRASRLDAFSAYPFPT
jgi:hypothetical protein